jgi:hypothetical protein
MLSRFKGVSAVAALAVTAGLAMSAAPGMAAASATAPKTVRVAEHFQGRTYTLTPGNWHGATQCAVVTPTVAYCFRSEAQFAAFTSTARSADGSAVTAGHTSAMGTASPAATGACDGWAKIWNGANFTNRGLAFQDYGYNQNLSDYVTVPFYVVSYFTNGQREYAPMTNCYGNLWNSAGTSKFRLHTNASATNLGTSSFNAWHIQLYLGVG